MVAVCKLEETFAQEQRLARSDKTKLLKNTNSLIRDVDALVVL